MLFVDNVCYACIACSGVAGGRQMGACISGASAQFLRSFENAL